MPRRVRLIMFLGVITMLVLATGISAGATPDGDIQSTEAEIAAAQERLMEIRTEASAAHGEYDNALFRMNELNVKIEEAEEDLGAAEEQLAEAQKDLEARASEVYKSGNVAFINVLVGVDNFSQFATRLDLWMRLLGEEKAQFEAVLEAKNDLEARKSALETERALRVEAIDEALANKERAAASEAEAEAYLNSLNGELQAAIQAEEERQARLAQQAAAEAAKRAAEEEAPEPEPQPDLEALEAEAAAAAAAELRAQLAAERAAAAERRDEREAAKEAAEQAALEREAAQQALAEQRAAERAAQRRAELQAQREADRQALAEQREAERLAEKRAERRAARDASAAALASASSSASASASAGRGGGRGGGGGGGGGGRASGTGLDVVEVSAGHIETPYGPSPCQEGVEEDCSCHTMLVYAEFGIELPDSPAAQYSYGRPVRGEPIAGDLVFYAEGGGGITHVGIATGEGTVIDANIVDGMVWENPIDQIPGRVGARRLL
jgi:peptidoglycan DL-endopeptidase RipA